MANKVQEIEIEIELSEPQTAVLESRQQLILEMSGQGGGKSQNIGYSSGMLISEFPELLGFIGANTYLQLSQSTLDRVFKTWKADKGFEEWDAKACPWGAYVVDKKPPPHFQRLHKLRDYAGTISFYNGCLVFIGSLENYKAHEGKEFAWAHLDETKDTKEKALKEVILGRLRQRGLYFDRSGALHYSATITAAEQEANGWTAWNPLYIHTSPAIDGAEWLLKMFKLDKFEKEIKKKCQARRKDFFYREFENKAVCIYSAYHNEENLAPGFLQNQEANLGDESAILKLVDGYPFGQAGNAWFWAFRRDRHVRSVPYIPGLPVSLTWDFNVIPYMTCLAFQVEHLTRYMDQVGNKYDEARPGFFTLEVLRLRFYKEYCFESPRNSIDAICQQFRQEHDPLKTEVFYYGDAMGLNRIEGLGNVTRFKIMEDFLFEYLHNDSKRVKNPNVMPLKRKDLMNDIFRGKYPHIEIWIDEEMAKTIEDCENVKQGVDGKIKPKVKDPATGKQYEKWGHTSDALEYAASEVCKFLMQLG
jgi:hypothetical protein